MPASSSLFSSDRSDRRRLLTGLDFATWATTYFGSPTADAERDGILRNVFDRPNGPHQNWLQSRCNEAARGITRTIYIQHRSGGKSANASVGLPIFVSCNGWKSFFLLISPVWRNLLQNIFEQLEENPLLKNDWGHRLQPAKDAKKQFKSYRDGVIHLSGGTVIAGTGPDGPIRGVVARAGLRPDLIVIDDPQKEVSRINRDASNLFIRKIEESIMPAMPPGQLGSFMVVDSWKGSASASALLIEKKKAIWDCRVARAFDPITGEPESFITADERERIIRDIGAFAYSQEYQSIDGRGDGALFDLPGASWLGAERFPIEELPGGARRYFLRFDPEDYVRIWGCPAAVDAEGFIRVGVRRTITALDVAHGFSDQKGANTKAGDFFAATTASRLDRPTTRGEVVWAIPAAQIWPFGEVVTNASYGSKLDYILRAAIGQARHWGSETLIVESNGAQKYLGPPVSAIVAELRRTIPGFRLGTSFLPAAGAKEPRIQRAEGPMNSGRIILSKGIQAEWVTQVGEFRMDAKKQHDDAPDSMEVALRHATGGLSLGRPQVASILSAGYTDEHGEDE